MPLSTASDDDCRQLLEQLTAREFGTVVELLDLHRYVHFLEASIASIDDDTSITCLACAMDQLHDEIRVTRSDCYAQELKKHEEDIEAAKALYHRMQALTQRIEGRQKVCEAFFRPKVVSEVALQYSKPDRRGGAVSDQDYQFMRQIPVQELSQTLKDGNRRRAQEQLSLRTLRRALRGPSPVPMRFPIEARGPVVAPPGLKIDRPTRLGNRSSLETILKSTMRHTHMQHFPSHCRYLSMSQIPRTPTQTPIKDLIMTTIKDQGSINASDKENIGMPRARHPTRKADPQDRLSTPEAAFLSLSDGQYLHSSRKLPEGPLQQAKPQVSFSDLPMYGAICHDKTTAEQDKIECDGQMDISRNDNERGKDPALDPTERPVERLNQRLRALRGWTQGHPASLSTDDGYDGQSEAEGSSCQLAELPRSKPASRPLPPIPRTPSITSAKNCRSRHDSMFSSAYVSKLPADVLVNLDLGVVADVESIGGESDITVEAPWSDSGLTMSETAFIDDEQGFSIYEDPDCLSSAESSLQRAKTQPTNLAYLVSRLSDQSSLGSLKRLHETMSEDISANPTYHCVFKNHEETRLQLARPHFARDRMFLQKSSDSLEWYHHLEG